MTKHIRKGGCVILPEYIASVSFGKDSLCMLLMLLEKEYPLDEVVFYNTGMEFQAIYDTRDKVLPLLMERGIQYTELHPKNPFLYDMLERPVTRKDGTKQKGYSWCGRSVRWGTRMKNDTIRSYLRKKGPCIQYVGLAHDEFKRIPKAPVEGKVYPLVDWRIPGGEALAYCYSKGYTWMENGKPLYSILNNVSCWCCANKCLKELRGYYYYLPEYWEKLKDLQRRTPYPMRGPRENVFELEERFIEERSGLYGEEV